MSVYEKVGGEVTVNSVLSGSQTRVDLARLADGRFVAIWESGDIKGRLMAADGTPLGAEFLINTATLDTQDKGSVTGLADGGFVVTWTTWDEAQDGSSFAIKAQVFDATGAKRGGEFLVNTHTGNVQWDSSVAALDNGGFVIAWDTYGNPADSGRGISAQIYDAAGAKVGSEFLVNTATGDFQQGCEISTLSGGRFVVTWLTQISGQFDVRAQVFDASGAKIGAEILVNTQTALSQTELTVTDLANGGFVVAWTSFDTTQDGSGYAVKAQVFDAAGVKLGSELLVNTSGASNQRLPSVEGLANGDFVIAWRTDDTTADQASGAIKAQVFDAAGAKIGAEFLVNTAGAAGETEPSVVDLGNGAFAVAWRGLNSSGEIQSQVFSSGSAPVIHSNGGGASAALTVAEDTTAVTAVQAYDIDGPSVAYSIAGGADAAQFAIDSATGALTFLAVPDFEAPTDGGADNVYEVVVRASDGERIDEQALLVTVASSADVTAITSNGGADSAAIAVLENGVSVTTVAAAGSGPMAYSIVGGADAARFQIDTATGALAFKAAPNREAPTDAGGDNVYDVVVGASNGWSLDTQALAVSVGNVNEAPTIHYSWLPPLNNGVAVHTTVNEGGSVAVSPVTFADPDGDTLTYTAGGDDIAAFTFNPVNRTFTFNAIPDYEAPASAAGTNSYSVTLTATDGEFTSWVYIGIHVQNVNEGLAITSLGGGATAALTVSENTGAVTTVAASDIDGTAPAYSISGGADAARFAIDASTGALSFVAAPDFEAPADAGGDNVYDVVVRASDGTFADTQAIAVTVTDAAAAPVIVSDGGGASAALEIDEGASAVTTVVATDLEGPEPVSYAIAGGADAALFAIDAVSGALGFVAAPDYEAPGDADGDNLYEVSVAASDGELTTVQAISVLVRDVAEPTLAFEATEFEEWENYSEGAWLGIVGGDELEPAVYQITGGADAALFELYPEDGLLLLGPQDYEAPADADGDNVYEIEVTAQQGVETVAATLRFTVNDINEAPSFVSGTDWSLAEGNDFIGVLEAADPEDDGLHFYIVGGADADLFQIIPWTGEFGFYTAPDFEAPADADGDNVYELEVGVHDDYEMATQTIYVTVNDVAEDIAFAQTWFDISENDPAAGTLSLDSNASTVTFAIAGGTDAELFALDGETGELTFLVAPDYESPHNIYFSNYYELQVTATAGSSSVTEWITVQVHDVDEAPVFASTALATNENSLFAGFVSASDPEYGPGNVTYRLAGGADASRFTIDRYSGELRFRSTPNFESPADAGANNVYNVLVEASDGWNDTVAALTVTVLKLNEAPVILSNGGGASANLSISENTSAVTTVTASDPEGAGSLIYTIAGGADAALFAIDTATGQLRFTAGPDREAPADQGANNVYDVVVRASDGGGLSDTQALAITVANVNEAPVITSNGGGASVSITRTENGSGVTVVTAIDPEGGVTYSISGGADAARFTINAGTGVLSFVTAPNFEAPTDAGANNVYDVVVRASDGTLSDTQALAVSVTNIDEAPVITSNGGGATAALSVSENAAAVTTVAATDPDSAISYSIAGGADAARFAINAATGALSFVAAPDFEAPADADGNNVYDVVVRAGGGALADTQALTVTVTDVASNTLTFPSTAYALYENDNLFAALFVTGGSGAGTTVYEITGGADADLFYLAGPASLAFASQDFEAPYDADGDNVYEVVITATNGEDSGSATYTVTVQDDNEGSYFFSPDVWSLAENTAAVGPVVADDLRSSAPIAYSVSGGADGALFEIDSASGALGFIAAPDFEAPGDADGDNLYELVVGATWNGSTVFQTLTVAVGNSNEAPVITSGGGGASANLLVSENATAVTTVTAADPESGALAFAIAGGADAALFAIDAASGALGFLAVPDSEAPGDADADNVYEVVVSVSDGSLADTQALSVAIGDVGEAPVITSNGAGVSAAISVAENGVAVTAVSASDPEGGVSYSIAGGADAARFAIDAASGVLTFVAAPDFEAPADAGGDNVYDVIVRASDGTLSDTQALAVTVGGVNEAPVIASNGGGSAAQLAASENATAVTTVAAGDPEGGVSYALAGGADAALFAIDAQTGALSFLAAPNFEAPGDAGGDNVYEVVVSASDGTLVDTQALAVTVGNVNEGPAIVSNGGGAAAGVTVAENGTAVTTVAATDPEGGLTYTLAGGADAIRFAIDAATGALSFLAATDYEAPGDADGDNVYEVVVRAGDGELADDQALSVTVANVNEAVTITSPSSAAVLENTLAAATVTATDLDGDAIAFAILGGADAASFAIDAATGALSFLAAPNFEAPTDADANNLYQVIVGASDGSFADSLALSIAVSNVDETPVITSNGGGAAAALAVNENSTAVTTVAATAPEGAVVFALAGGADAARFTINAATGALAFVTAPDADAPADAGADNVYEVIVSASHGALSDTQTLAVTVNNLVDGIVYAGTPKNDTRSGTYQEDTLQGSLGNDTLYGLGGADVIEGGDGIDKLYGGAGADLLTGGLKSDTFFYTALSDSTVAESDHIVDWARTQGDKISLAGIDANALVGGDQAFTFIHTAGFSNVAGQLRFYQSGGQTFLQGDVDGNGTADLQIVIDQSVILYASDFVF